MMQHVEGSMGDATVFERHLSVPAALARHKSAPLVRERERFLLHLETTGTKRSAIRIVSTYLLQIVKILGLRRLRDVTLEEVDRAADLNPEMQITEIREFCKRRDWEVVREFVDRGISGSREHRPELDKLMADCKKKKVDCVVVYRYDRFARSLRQLVTALDEFRALGIDFVSLHEGVDTSTPNGRLVFGIFATIAELERELIRERVKSGLALAKSRGKQLGRPRVVVDAPQIALLRSQGRSWSEICDSLGLTKGTAQRAVLGLPKNVPEIAAGNF